MGMYIVSNAKYHKFIIFVDINVHDSAKVSCKISVNGEWGTY